MFILTQYLLKSFLNSKISNTSLSTYTIVIGLVIYALFYSYFMMYNRDLLPFFNKIIIYIIGIDLLLSAFYNYNIQLENPNNNTISNITNQNLLEMENFDQVSEETDDEEETDDQETDDDVVEETVDEDENSEQIPQLYEERMNEGIIEDTMESTNDIPNDNSINDENNNKQESIQNSVDLNETSDLTNLTKNILTESQIIKKRGRPSKNKN